MKSIMEEASSVAQAIEKGWARAGKPQEFTVKVFEEAQTSFFGFLTSKPAKIGLFFQETGVNQQTGRHQKDRAPQTSAKKYTANVQNQPQQARQTPPRAPQQQQQNSTPQPRPERAPRTELHSATPWSPELVDAAQEWVKDSLQLMNLNSVSFTTEADRYALKFTFSKSLLELNEKEKMLFRSWAYLIMQALRQKFKRPLKGLKVILTSNA